MISPHTTRRRNRGGSRRKARRNRGDRSPQTRHIVPSLPGARSFEPVSKSGSMVCVGQASPSLTSSFFKATLRQKAFGTLREDHAAPGDHPERHSKPKPMMHLLPTVG
eukprot:scaffold499_cov335-Pavlova_lutheri.AAC.41